jgi:Flp pilus assembly protein TadG
VNFTTTLPSRPREERGAILILTALIMIVLLLIAAFATDLGAWYRQGQEQQRAADVASLNGIQAYDAALKQYIDDKGATSLSELSTADQLEAEETAMQAALDAITGALAAGGMLINDSPTPSYATPPAVSSAFVAAADGSQIQVTRTADNELIVNVTQEGTQYFSNFVRDAPDISRDGTAVISNCNADCSRDIELEPPFQGFAAAGKGDGYRPLVGENDTIWTVNHHAGAGAVSNYSIVCMDTNTEAQCANWSAMNQKYNTHSKADDVIDNDRDKIYFPANNGTTAGIACVRTDVRQWCSGNQEFTSLTNNPHNFSYSWGQPMLSIHGVWRVGDYPNDRLFAIGQDGKIHCFLPDNLGSANPYCSGYPQNTAIVGLSNVPGSNSTQRSVIGELVGDKIISHHFRTDSASRWQCWDTSTNSSCWGSAVNSGLTSYGGWGAMKFIRYNASGNQVGMCISPGFTSINGTISLPHECISLTGSIQGDVPGLTLNSNGDTGLTFGEGHTWLGPDGEAMMFFGSLSSNTINCYDWVTSSFCGAFTGVDIYGMTTLNKECVIGVGDSANFYTFNPLTQEACTGSEVETDVWPCACADGTYRYGVLELPPELLAVLESAEATVSGGGMSETGDLLASPMDLSGFNGVAGPLKLVISVDSKLDGDGNLLWTETYSASLALTVQPTLAE